MDNNNAGLLETNEVIDRVFAHIDNGTTDLGCTAATAAGRILPISGYSRSWEFHLANRSRHAPTCRQRQ